jgi:hypothetical protein
MTDEQKRDLESLKAWLRSRGTILWGRAFDVEDDPEAAARWFLAQIDSYVAWREANRDATA